MHIYTGTNININAYIHVHVYSLRDGLLADALRLNRYTSVMRANTYACKHMYKCLHNCIYENTCIHTSRRTVCVDTLREGLLADVDTLREGLLADAPPPLNRQIT